MKLTCLLSMYLLLCGCTTYTVSDGQFLIPDARLPAAESLGNGYVSEQVAVTHSDGIVTRGVYYHSPQVHITILGFGGNGFHLDLEGGNFVNAMTKAGANIMMFDYRGYGRSDGSPTGALLASDGIDEYQFAKAKMGPEDHLVVYGFSMGTLVAAHVAQTQHADGLVLESGPTDVQGLIRNGIPWYGRPFVKLKLGPDLLLASNLNAVSNYDGPLLILSGEKDPLIPAWMSEALYKQARSARKQLYVFPNGGHGNVEDGKFPTVLHEFLVKEIAGGGK